MMPISQVNPIFVDAFSKNGMKFVGRDVEGKRMEILELPGTLLSNLDLCNAIKFCAGHPYFAAVQYHPEFLTRPLKPSPPFLGLLLASCNKLQLFIERGCRISPSHEFGSIAQSDSDDEEVIAYTHSGATEDDM